MPFDWIKFVSLAEELCHEKNDEAALRSSVSRAYYGAFGKTRIYFSSHYTLRESNGDGVHQKIIETLKKSSIKEEYSLGNTLSLLRTSRNDADYESHSTFNKTQVQEIIRKSKSLLDQLSYLNRQ